MYAIRSCSFEKEKIKPKKVTFADKTRKPPSNNGALNPERTVPKPEHAGLGVTVDPHECVENPEVNEQPDLDSSIAFF